MRFFEIALFESQNYEGMFRAYLDVIDESDVAEKRRIENIIRSCRKQLRKNDRIVWFLRLWRIGEIKQHIRNVLRNRGYYHDQAQPEKEISLLTKLLDQYVKEYAARSGASDEIIIDSGERISSLQDQLLVKLEHYFSLPIEEIQNHTFRYELPFDWMKRAGALERQWQESRKGLIPSEHAQQGAQEIIKFPNGYSWWMLDRASCKFEADAMGHCGNMPGQHSNDRLLSLRKPVKRGKQVFYEPFLTFILDENGKLGEMKGRFNNSPKNAFKKGFSQSDFSTEILALLESPYVKGIKGGGYAPEENFKISDLPQEMLEKLEKTKPTLMPFVFRLKKEGLSKPLIQDMAMALSKLRASPKKKELGQFDEAQQAFLWDHDVDMREFIGKHVEYNTRDYRRAIALWIYEVVETSDESLDFYYDGTESQYRDEILKEFEKTRPEEHAKLKVYLERVWNEVAGNSDEDDEDGYHEDMPDDLATVIDQLKREDETVDAINSALKHGAIAGLDRGAENEMSEYWEKWIENLKRPNTDSFWITFPEWDEKYYESTVNIMISPQRAAELIDSGRLESGDAEYDEDLQFKVEDIDEPRYGFSGFDEETAEEVFWEDCPEIPDAE